MTFRFLVHTTIYLVRKYIKRSQVILMKKKNKAKFKRRRENTGIVIFKALVSYDKS